MTFSEKVFHMTSDLGLFKHHIITDHLGDEPCMQIFKTDTLPPPHHSLTETHCATVSIVYIRNDPTKMIK